MTRARLTILTVLLPLLSSSPGCAASAPPMTHDAQLRAVDTLTQRLSRTVRREVRKPVRDQRERDFQLLAGITGQMLEQNALAPSQRPSLERLHTAAAANDRYGVRAAYREFLADAR